MRPTGVQFAHLEPLATDTDTDTDPDPDPDPASAIAVSAAPARGTAPPSPPSSNRHLRMGAVDGTWERVCAALMVQAGAASSGPPGNPNGTALSPR
ncbi:hypothetical protein OG863_35560 [Streptomyces decoyicus]|uniref:Uncharacterized protein n=1 Tax=Streptomyces decoyicus TaxID=249567 RepID=A0ABZ1FS75_9ACTN|nr:hypothetical protein [Streptomyces decoyicus]WSB72843.1 hypothetical protein OG863_35560 [Streptomyces decoyicus]